MASHHLSFLKLIIEEGKLLQLKADPYNIYPIYNNDILERDFKKWNDGVHTSCIKNKVKLPANFSVGDNFQQPHRPISSGYPSVIPTAEEKRKSKEFQQELFGILSRKIEILSGVFTSSGGQVLVKDGDNFYLEGKLIVLSVDTNYYKLLTVLYKNGDQQGFLSYKNIKELLRWSKQKTVSNAYAGIFCWSKINGNKLKNSINGHKLISVRRGAGLVLHNY